MSSYMCSPCPRSIHSAKRSNQEKAAPMMAVRASHGLHTPLAPKSGIVRNSLRSDSGRFFFRFRHQRRVAIDGDHVKNNSYSTCNGNGNGNGNCNCRYAERQTPRRLSRHERPVHPHTAWRAAAERHNVRTAYWPVPTRSATCWCQPAPSAARPPPCAMPATHAGRSPQAPR